ncbi:MAG: acetyl-CoA carboxylase biotin carboxyl carrier protein [Solirubrobacteraceae bacterium]
MSLTDDDVREILRIIDESELEELRLETDGLSLYVRRGGSGSGPPLASDPVPAGGSEAVGAGSASRSPSPSATASAAQDDGLLTVPAPMLGTFYRADGPGRPPFVDVGSTVEPDTIVCIIEVMKMMNSISAGVSGTVVEVCHENAVLAEYGAPLFRVRPA